MKIKNILYLIPIVFLISCENDGTPEIRQLDFYDYVNVNGNGKREKGYLINNPPQDINELESLLFDYLKGILSADFISQFVDEMNARNPTVKAKLIEIDFFRVSKELPWIMKEDYRPPYHLGEGNPGDWIGRFIYDANSGEICSYAVFNRGKSFFNYGKIVEEIKHYKDEELIEIE